VLAAFLFFVAVVFAGLWAWNKFGHPCGCKDGA